MFVRREKQNHHNDSFSKHKATKNASITKSYSKRSFKDGKKDKKASSFAHTKASSSQKPTSPSDPSNLNSPIITLTIGPSARLFAAHESILLASPFFHTALKSRFLESTTQRIALPEEIPEVFSSVLEYLYKGDYSPTLLHNKRQNSWQLDLPSSALSLPPLERGATVFHGGVGARGGGGGGGGEGGELLKDTLVYCAADRYGLDELKRLALRKQGLQTGVSVKTILDSARYAYANTPEEDSKLRAHYLALVIRSRATFKRSGTMQAEMERGGGGGLWFDLFVALCNHLDDLAAVSKSPRTPKTL